MDYKFEKLKQPIKRGTRVGSRVSVDFPTSTHTKNAKNVIFYGLPFWTIPGSMPADTRHLCEKIEQYVARPIALLTS